LLVIVIMVIKVIRVIRVKKKTDQSLDLFQLKKLKIYYGIWNLMEIHCLGLVVVNMFAQARLKLRKARVSMTSTSGMVDDQPKPLLVVGAAGLIVSIC